jgi:HK97 family phage major capsid protein
MKSQFSSRLLFTLALVGVLFAASCLGHPFVSPEAMAGLGMLPLAFGGEVTIADIRELVVKQGDVITERHKDTSDRIAALEGEVKGLAMKGNRPSAGGPPANIDAKSLAHIEAGVRSLLKGDQVKANASFAEAKAMSVGSGPDGGYLDVPTFSSEMTKVMAEISPLYRLARVIPLTTATSFEEIVDRDQVQTAWVGETSGRPDTDTAKLGKFALALREIYAMPKVTQALIDGTGINVMEWLREKCAEGFALAEGSAFHVGDGVAKPRGILTYPTAATADATRPWGTVQHIVSGASGAFITPTTSAAGADCLIDTVTALRAQYRNGACWLMNRLTAGACRKLKTVEGAYIWQDGLIAGQPSTILGFPVEIDEAMPDISANSLSIAFGNWKRAYTVIEGPGIKFLTDPYTDKPNVRLYSYRRVDGGVNNTEAYKLVKFA